VLWIDVTDTFLNWIGSPTGIQRTLIGLAEASKRRINCSLCVWDKQSNLWRQIPDELFLSIFSNKSELYGFVKKPFYINPFSRKNNKTKNVKQDRQSILANLSVISEWSSNDSILLADSLWNQEGFFTALKNISPHPRIIGFCYDLIPVDRPDFVIEPARIAFYRWIHEMLSNSNEVVCISNYTTKRLKKFIEVESLVLQQLESVRTVTFGNKIENSKKYQKTPRTLKEILNLHKVDFKSCSKTVLDSSNWIMWLGSIDVRKNIDVLLLALEHLVAEGKCNIPVIIAGKPAGGFEFYKSKILNNPILNKLIVLLESPSDELVKDIQEGARLFVFTSWEEGYGLPIAEALQMGIPVISSGSTSIQEVAGKLADYFEPWDSRGLAELIERFESHESYRNELKERAKSFSPTNWEDTLDDILGKSMKRESF
jgi:glycosyltransferase involved in cell wall biosynthesis